MLVTGPLICHVSTCTRPGCSETAGCQGHAARAAAAPAERSDPLHERTPCPDCGWKELERDLARSKFHARADVVDDLAHTVRLLARALRRAAPEHDLPERALDYLQRQGLQATVLRDPELKRGEAFDSLPDDYELG